MLHYMKPSWLKIKLPGNDDYQQVKATLKQERVTTVCIDAKCPNRIECWGRRAMTFMILGHVCTRNCGFCAVTTGNPKAFIDQTEPARIARTVKKLNLSNVIITSVTRDDLGDGGASVFAQTIKAIKSVNPEMKTEVLVPDFAGAGESIKQVIDAGCDIFAHNVETVSQLTPLVRDKKANYDISLQVLKTAHRISPNLMLKSGFMVGLGETEQQVKETIDDLLKAGIHILTIGQYLQPARPMLAVREYITPAGFSAYKQYALDIGIKYVFAGPLVRSSYARIC
ncbi:MAG: lipoyl synthase [Candidatus Latescibacteria bacterium]|nr:lipoyl synthase [Candidatus Latescibacterota bacterium]